MSEKADPTDRLRAALERLSQANETWIADPAPDGEGAMSRQLDATRPDAVLSALLLEVEDTVLPARLTLSGSGGHVAVAAAGRRVQALLSVSDSIVEQDGDLVETILDEEGLDTAKALGEMLRRLLEGGGPFAIRSDITTRFGVESEPGLAPNRLSTLWGIVSQDSNTHPLEQFLTLIEPDIKGGLLRDGDDVVLMVGDQSLEEPLADVLDAAWVDFSSERAKGSDDHNDPSLTCWQQPEGPIVGVAAWSEEDGHKRLVALAMLDDSLAKVISTWNDNILTI